MRASTDLHKIDIALKIGSDGRCDVSSSAVTRA
jgi:hypothetical protein